MMLLEGSAQAGAAPPSRNRVLLLTGAPGAGKTTVVREALSRTGIPAAGFFTEDIREEGQRVGFKLVTLDGRTAMLAHVKCPGPHSVGKYKVNMQELESVGVAALQHAIESRGVVVVDEIGKMEMLSAGFRQAVQAAIGTRRKVLGTIMAKPHPWADQVKALPDVWLVEVNRSNRDQVLSQVIEWLSRDSGTAP